MAITDREKKGLKVFVGSEYNVRVGESKNSTEKLDFTQQGNIRMLFPTSNSIKKEVEILETARIGLPTPLKFLGKTQITGDLGDVVTPNGSAWYSDMVFGGTVKSLDNNQALISIESEDKFLINITRAANKTAKVDIVLDETTTKSVTITENMTVQGFIDAVNAFKNENEEQLFLAVLHIGEGTEILNFEGTENSYNCSIREFFRVGELSEAYKKKVAPYINFIIPRRGEARYFNMLVSSQRAPASYQYYGCRFLSMNMQYQNNNLTNLTANIWGGYVDEFEGEPTQAEIDDVSTAFAQTNGRTKAYACRQRATTIASMTNNFAWTVEPQWNISNEPYEIPVSKYTDSYDFEMMFNEQSRNLFEKYVNEGRNISILLDTSTFKSGKEYKIIKSSKTLLGQPQYPDLADGVIQLTASGFTAVASISDPYTSMMIVTSDKQFKITYTQEEIEKDFPAFLK